MSIPVTCRDCKLQFAVGEHFAGRRGICPECGGTVRVPSVEAELSEVSERSVDVAPPRPRRLRPPPTPADHLPEWRRVARGFRFQQLGACCLILSALSIVAAMTMFAPSPADFATDDMLPKDRALLVGGFAGLIGFGVQTIGRLVSTGTPVRAPRVFSWISAGASAVSLPAGFCTGLLIVAVAGEQQGNPAQANAGLVMLVGFGMIGFLGLVAGAEISHCFAIGGIGRVLKSDRVRIFGRYLGVSVIVLGGLALVSLCMFGAWSDAENPNADDPALNELEERWRSFWIIGVGIASGLYLCLDILLLQLARSVIARLGAADRSSIPSTG